MTDIHREQKMTASLSFSRLHSIVLVAQNLSAVEPRREEPETAIPDMRGTWKGESETIILGIGNPHHAATPSAEPRLNSVSFTMTIDKQDGRRISGTFSSARGSEARRRTGWSFVIFCSHRPRASHPARS